MGSDNPNLEAIDERLEGDPIRLGDRSVTPVGRMTGKRFEGGNEHAGGFGMILTLQPEEIIVRESGQERAISMAPTDTEPLRALFVAGGAVAGGCLVIMFLSRRIIQRIF